jgi:hypothetical protein
VPHKGKFMQKNQNSNKAKLNLLMFKYFSYLNYVAAVLIIGAGFIFIIRPKYGEIGNEVEAKLAGYRFQLDERDNYLNRLIDLNRIYEKIDKSNRDKIGGMLPEDYNGTDLMRQLEKIVKSNGALLTSLNIIADGEAIKSKNSKSKSAGSGGSSPQRTVPENVGKIYAELEIEGVNYSVLKKLLASLENSIRLIDVEEVNFIPEDMTVKIQLAAYYLK